MFKIPKLSFMVKKTPVPSRIQVLEASISLAESRIFPNAGKHISVKTIGRRNPVYEPTTADMINRYFDKMGDQRIFQFLKPGSTAIDMGAGFGRVCFALADVKDLNGRLRFKKVIGYEFDERLSKESSWL